MTADDDTLTGIAETRRALPRLRAAVTTRDATIDGAGYITGANTPSWEPIRLSAVALLQDITRETPALDRQVRRVLGLPPRPPARLEDALTNLAVSVEALQRAASAPLTASDARRCVLGWVHRSRAVLGDLSRPYALRGPDGRDTPCPVIAWTPYGPDTCGRPLMVHRDNTGTPSAVACALFPADHAWTVGPPWLQLGALLRHHIPRP